jgi:hypothetical protein
VTADGRSPVRAFADHDEGGHAREIGLIGNRDQIEQQPHLLIDRDILLGPGYLGRLHAREIAVLRKLNAPFDLSHRVQVAVEDHFIARAQLQLQRPGPFGDEIKDAPFLPDDGHALFRCSAFTE